MDKNPFAPDIIFNVGPIPIDNSVVTTWVIMAVLTFVSWYAMNRADVCADAFQEILEIFVLYLAKQVEDIIQRDPWPYLPLIGTLFLFLVFANLTAIVPGMKPPTGQIETPSALAVIVFVSVHIFGIRSRGLAGYLLRYIKPNPLLLPLNLLSEITRTFSLMVRLFGNIMSHEFVIAIIVYLAALFLPVPFMLLGILIGLIQAYIFTALASVYIGAAVGSGENID